MFVHRSEIPKDFAMAVYRVMHNQATFNDWETFDAHAKNALPWIQSILEDNGVENIEEEMNWWKSQLSYPYN